MKKTRILGIGLSLMLLVSLFGFALPVAAGGPGEQLWDYNTAPSGSYYKTPNGGKVADYVVADGEYMYLVDGTYGSTDKNVYRSSNNGLSWSSKSTAYKAIDGEGKPVAVGVAPDDKLSIAVADDTGKIHISSDEGDTWRTLPALPADSASGTITAVAVGPARSGLLLDREYAVAIADPTANCTDAPTKKGDILILGASATWTSAASVTGITGTRDYVALQFSPNFIGDRVLLAVGADNVTGTTATISYQVINSSTKLVLSTTTLVTGTAGGLDVGSASAVRTADIALPTDFDPSSTTGNLAFVSVSSGAAADDAFKVTPSAGTVKKDLGLDADVHSVAYSGTVDSGTLFAGIYNTSTVKRCDDPFVSTLTWKSSIKAPTGLTPMVRVDNDYASNNRVYAATITGPENAFNVSDDNGVSWYQTSGISNGQGTDFGIVLDMQWTPNGADDSCWFLTNDDDTAPFAGDLHLWERPGGGLAYSSKWLRHYTVTIGGTANNTGLLALNPDWETTPAIYIVDTSAAGASTIYISKNRGATWATRTAPGSLPVSSIALSDADTVYVVTDDKKYYQSTNAGWTWSDPQSAYQYGTGNLFVTDNNWIVGGGKGRAMYNYAGVGSSLSSSTYGLPSTVFFQAVVDVDFADSTIIYIGGDDGSVWRRAHFADPVWIDISPTTNSGAIIEMAIKNGVMYALTADSVLRNDSYGATPNVAAAAWEDMTAGTGAYKSNDLDSGVDLANLALEGDNIVWVSKFSKATGTYHLYSYRDVMASEVPTLTSPPDGYEVAVDTTTGKGEAVIFTWETMGTGNSVPDTFQMQIQEVGGITFESTNFGVTDISAPSVSSTNAAIDYTFRANKEYQWRLRVRDTLSDDAIRSAWTDWQNLSVGSGTIVQQPHAGPILLGPQGGAMTSLQPGFSWAPIPGATEYEFILATDAGLTQTVANTPVALTSPAFSVAADLDEDTTYFWAVKSTKPTVGQQAINTFTTRAPAVAVTPPAAPPADIIVQAPDIVWPDQPPAQAAPSISDGILYTIIGIGAILIIAVLVLIVRTRRPL